jgi:DNA invertase Pin-like site-specific DNA recombinase
MGGKIPKTIRRRVIKQGLHGFPRDQIAKGNQIGAGTVSTIINHCKLEEQQKKEYAADDDFEFDLIRELAMMLKKRRC